MAETTKKTALKKASATKAAKATPTKTAAGPKAVAAKTADQTAAGSATNLRVMPDHEEISRRAYELWAERGFSHGDPNHDWARAEQELRRA